MKTYLFFAFSLCAYFVQSQILQPYDHWVSGVRYGDIELTDIDKDSDLDMIVSGELQGTGDCATRIYKNDGSGNFVNSTSLSVEALRLSSISSGDIDGDHDIDFFISGYTIESIPFAQTYLNNGSGLYTEGTNNFVGVYFGESKLFDADKDGDLDLFYFGNINTASEQTKLYLNNGSGLFTDSGHSFPPNHVGSIDISDVNKDGFKDILMCGEANGIPSTTRLLINNGNATFTQSTQNFEPISYGTATFIDLENDGDDDIIVNGIRNGYGYYKSSFYINDSIGNFTFVGNRGLDPLYSTSIAKADVDDDGDIDVFLTGMDSLYRDTCALYYNVNGYFYKDTNFISQGLKQGDAVFGRLDKNCSPDLVYTGYALGCDVQFYCLLNQTPNFSCPPPTPIVYNPVNVIFRVRPNPFKDKVYVDVNFTVDKAKVVDSQGNRIEEKSINSKTIEFDLSDQLNGTYVIEFTVPKFDNPFQVKVVKMDVSY